jgi:hypothetical protein
MSKDLSSTYGKKYLLNTNTGVVHNLTKTEAECQIDKIKPEHIYLSDYLYSDIKKHSSYKEECDFCMNPDG